MYLPLPEAYRSLSRPSSPVSTKASTVCPKKLDSMFEISHADFPTTLRLPEVSTLCRSFDQPTTGFHCWSHRLFCRKNFVFGNQNIFKDHVRTARGIAPDFSLFAVNQIIFLSIWMSKSGLSRHRAESTVRFWKMVGLIGLEPMTPALSRRCSNQLSYRPRW